MATIRRSTKKDNTRKRIPVGEARNILTVQGKEKGFVYRWVNDVDNRITEFKQAGYDHVVDDSLDIGSDDVKQGSVVGKTISKSVGQGVTAYLMRIKEEWYKEDQQAKLSKVDSSEELIRANVNKITGRYGKVEIN